MKIRNLTKDHDITFGKGYNNYLDENRAIALNIKTRLLEWYNDCFFNMTAGIDYKARLEKRQKDRYDQDVKTIIANSYGVSEIVSYSSILYARKVTINYNIRTIFGKTFNEKIEVMQ